MGACLGLDIQPDLSLLASLGILEALGLARAETSDRPSVWREPLVGSQCFDSEKRGIRKPPEVQVRILSVVCICETVEELDAAQIPESENIRDAAGPCLVLVYLSGHQIVEFYLSVLC